jgi:hypothetical protein
MPKLAKHHNYLPTHLILIKDSSFQSRWRVLYLYHLMTFPLPYKAQLEDLCTLCMKLIQGKVIIVQLV